METRTAGITTLEKAGGNEADSESENTHDAENADLNESEADDENGLESRIFTVKKITDSKFAENGVRFYKVQWADSWEPEQNLYGCMELINEYWERMDHKCEKRDRESRKIQCTPPKRPKRVKLSDDLCDGYCNSGNEDSDSVSENGNTDDHPSISITHSPQVVVKKLHTKKMLRTMQRLTNVGKLDHPHTISLEDLGSSVNTCFPNPHLKTTSTTASISTDPMLTCSSDVFSETLFTTRISNYPAYSCSPDVISLAKCAETNILPNYAGSYSTDVVTTATCTSAKLLPGTLFSCPSDVQLKATFTACSEVSCKTNIPTSPIPTSSSLVLSGYIVTTESILTCSAYTCSSEILQKGSCTTDSISTSLYSRSSRVLPKPVSLTTCIPSCPVSLCSYDVGLEAGIIPTSISSCPVYTCSSNVVSKVAIIVASISTEVLSASASNEPLESKPVFPAIATSASHPLASWQKQSNRSQAIVVGDSDEEAAPMQILPVKEEPLSECENEEEQLFKRTAKLKASFVIKKLCETGELMSSDSDQDGSNTEEYFPDSPDSVIEHEKRRRLAVHDEDKCQRNKAEQINVNNEKQIEALNTYNANIGYRTKKSHPYTILSQPPTVEVLNQRAGQITPQLLFPPDMPNKPFQNMNSSYSYVGTTRPGSFSDKYFMQDRRPPWYPNLLPPIVNSVQPSHLLGKNMFRGYPVQTLPRISSIKQPRYDLKFKRSDSVSERSPSQENQINVSTPSSSMVHMGIVEIDKISSPPNDSIPNLTAGDIFPEVDSLTTSGSPIVPPNFQSSRYASRNLTRNKTPPFIPPPLLNSRVAIPLRFSAPIKCLPKPYVEAMVARIIYHVRKLIEVLRLDPNKLADLIQGLIAKGVVLTINESYLLDYPEPNFIETQVNSLMAIALKELPHDRLMLLLFNYAIPFSKPIPTKQCDSSNLLSPQYVSNPLNAVSGKTQSPNILTANPIRWPFSPPIRGLQPPLYGNHFAPPQYNKNIFHHQQGNPMRMPIPVIPPVTSHIVHDNRVSSHLVDSYLHNMISSRNPLNGPNSGYVIRSHKTVVNNSDGITCSHISNMTHSHFPLASSRPISSTRISPLTILSSLPTEMPNDEKNSAPCIVTDVRSLCGGEPDIEPLIESIDIHDDDLLMNGDVASKSSNSLMTTTKLSSIKCNSSTVSVATNYSAGIPSSQPKLMTQTMHAQSDIFAEMLKGHKKSNIQGKVNVTKRRAVDPVRYKDLVKQKYEAARKTNSTNIIDLTDVEPSSASPEVGSNFISLDSDKNEPS